VDAPNFRSLAQSKDQGDGKNEALFLYQTSPKNIKSVKFASAFVAKYLVLTIGGEE
jgi:hypothetical protein